MDNLLREMCRLVTIYHKKRYEWIAMPDSECKKALTMEFPVVQGITIQRLIEKIGNLQIDYESIGKELNEYFSKHSDNNDCTATRPADVSPKSPDGDFVQS